MFVGFELARPFFGNLGIDPTANDVAERLMFLRQVEIHLGHPRFLAPPNGAPSLMVMLLAKRYGAATYPEIGIFACSLSI
jgi:hypothetical protein